MLGKLAIALIAAGVLLPPSPAQQLRGPLISIPAPTASSSVASGRALAFGQRGAMRHFRRPSTLLTAPYFYSDYPTPEDSAESDAIASQPQVVYLQVPPPAQSAPAEPKPGALLIEWQGDRYVRIGGPEAATERSPRAPLDYVQAASAKPSARPAAKRVNDLPAPLAPVVLVYRDGRQESIRDYIITGGTIYARGDYWTDGYWNKEIQLAALNLPATMKASQDHGAKFILPASPNEVVVRP